MPKTLDQLALDQMVQALQPPLPMPDPRKVPLPTPDPREWHNRLPRVQNSVKYGDEAAELMPPNINPQLGDVGSALAPDYKMVVDPTDIAPQPLSQAPLSEIPVEHIIKYLNMTGKNI